jgi:hypothetical protein
LAPLAGQPVEFSHGEIHFPNGILKPTWDIVNPCTAIAFPKPGLVRTCAEQLAERSVGSRGVAPLVSPLLLGQEAPDKQYNTYCRASLPVLREITEIDTCDIDNAVQRLIGLGLGLTPSLDDVLLGMLYGLQRYAPDSSKTHAVRNAILIHAANNTHAISAAYLTAVAQGAMFELLDALITGLSGSGSLDIEPLLQIGSSSGSEMLLGLLLAAKMQLNSEQS